MRAAPVAERLALAGPAGALEAILETPPEVAAPAAAFMVVCHPHPLHGGTMDNKVVTTLARTAQELAAPTIRFNYRGVGKSSGSYDEGRGEMADALSVIAWGRQHWPGAALWLAGFSFGGAVALRAAAAPAAGPVARLVTVAPALGRNYATPGEIEVPACPWLALQGDADDVVDPVQNAQWLGQITPRPRLVMLPGVGHYFHGQLNALQEQVRPFLETGA